MASLSIGFALSVVAPGPAGENTVIAAIVTPMIQPVQHGHALADTLLASATDVGNYSSKEATISTVTAEWRVDGGSWTGLGTTTVKYDESVEARITVIDSSGNKQVFSAGTTMVAGVAPTLMASGSLAGRTLTMSVDSLTGVPAPAAALASLTLDGVDVLGKATGDGPWSYAVPDCASAQSIAWTITAINTAGKDSSSGSAIVEANLAAPVVLTAPGISPIAPAPGDTVTISEGTYAGAPTPTITGRLMLGGVDVTASMVGTNYTIPADTLDSTTLVWSETAINGIAPVANQQTSATVRAEAWMIDPGTGRITLLASPSPTAPAAPVVAAGRDEILIGEAA